MYVYFSFLFLKVHVYYVMSRKEIKAVFILQGFTASFRYIMQCTEKKTTLGKFDGNSETHGCKV